MAIESVTSSISSYSTPNTQTQQAAGSQQSQTAEKPAQRPEERVEKKEEPPRPVVNSLGQPTGTLINITA